MRWQSLGAEPWVVKTLRLGYRIPFSSLPPLSSRPVAFSTYQESSPRFEALAQEVSKMIEKGALEEVPNPDPGFYNRIFLVEKATGGWRPVIDLSLLNSFVRLTSFKMETVATVLASIRRGQFMASIDLKDAYFQIPVHPESRKYLRFVWKEKIF